MKRESIFERLLNKRVNQLDNDPNRDWEPEEDEEFLPTPHEPGTSAKIRTLIDRVEKGLPLFHEHDPTTITSRGTVMRRNPGKNE